MPQRSRTVVVVLFDRLQSLDASGPIEVFAAAERVLDAGRAIDADGSRRAPARGYEIRTLSASGAAVRTSSGLTIVPDGALADAPAEIDTLIVPGGAGVRDACADGELLAWIADASARARRTASVCTGAFLLAAAGLLDGRRATTHWSAAAALARLHPSVRVDADPIFVRDEDVWTSAGVTAGMDLALALVEDDHDRDVALTIARHLVLFLRRPGSQSQFSATLAAQQPAREPLREVLRSILDDPAGEHSVEAMAERAHMSARHFARAFRAETGVTPARHVERVRVEAARRRLEDTAETMRRAFLRVLAVAPAEYRRRFQARGASQQAQQSSTRRRADEHRDPSLRRLHRARRNRAV